jgi:hypothetical protein
MNIVFFILLLVLLGCADQSLGDPPQLQETLEIVCERGALKTCRVIGGNKFKRRYEYCTCVRTIN